MSRTIRDNVKTLDEWGIKFVIVGVLKEKNISGDEILGILCEAENDMNDKVELFHAYRKFELKDITKQNNQP